MDFTEKDFSRCRFNPLLRDFKQKYPHLFEIIPSEYEGDRETLLKYICLMYDPHSPLISYTADIETRKRVAAQYAGFNLNEEQLKSLFDLEDVSVIDTIDLFLRRHIHERLAYMVFANEQTFYEYGKRLLIPVKWDEASGILKKEKEKDILSAITIKSKLSEDMSAINERLEADEKKLYGEDPQLLKAVMKRKFTPEAYAQK